MIWTLRERLTLSKERCAHHSHVLHLPCFRERNYDGYCGKHNSTCWSRHWSQL